MKTKSEKLKDINNALNAAAISINIVVRERMRKIFGGCYKPPILPVSPFWKLIYSLPDGKTNKKERKE